jgi:hypothetical protein
VTAAAAAALASTVLAKGSVSDNNVTPGVLGFLVVAGMGIALYFLLRSLSRQLKKIPPPPADDAVDDAVDDGAAPAASAQGTRFSVPPGDRRD